MSSLELMRKRINHNNRKQEEDYQKEYNLRLARKEIGKSGVQGAVSAVPANSSTSGLVRIKNRNIQNFIEENGIQPVYEEYCLAYYRRSDKLTSLLEDYDIRVVMKNQL